MIRNIVASFAMATSSILSSFHNPVHYAVYHDTVDKEAYEILQSGDTEMQLLYAGGRLYEVRLGNAAYSYIPNTATFQLVRASPIIGHPGVVDVPRLFSWAVSTLACRGAFSRVGVADVSDGLTYVSRINADRSCLRVTVTHGGREVYDSLERLDINHVKRGFIWY